VAFSLSRKPIRGGAISPKQTLKDRSFYGFTTSIASGIKCKHTFRFGVGV